MKKELLEGYMRIQARRLEAIFPIDAGDQNAMPQRLAIPPAFNFPRRRDWIILGIAGLFLLSECGANPRTTSKVDTTSTPTERPTPMPQIYPQYMLGEYRYFAYTPMPTNTPTPQSYYEPFIGPLPIARRVFCQDRGAYNDTRLNEGCNP